MRECVIETITTYQLQTVGSRIVSPGKFEGQPIWLPALWESALESRGDCDIQDGDTLYTGFAIDSEIADVTGHRADSGLWILVWETSNGFVQWAKVTNAQIKRMEAYVEIA